MVQTLYYNVHTTNLVCQTVKSGNYRMTTSFQINFFRRPSRCTKVARQHTMSCNGRRSLFEIWTLSSGRFNKSLLRDCSFVNSALQCAGGSILLLTKQSPLFWRMINVRTISKAVPTLPIDQRESGRTMSYGGLRLVSWRSYWTLLVVTKTP